MRSIFQCYGRHRLLLAQQGRVGDTEGAGAVHSGFSACDEGLTRSGRRVHSHECGYADPDVKSPDACIFRTQPNVTTLSISILHPGTPGMRDRRLCLSVLVSSLRLGGEKSMLRIKTAQTVFYTCTSLAGCHCDTDKPQSRNRRGH